MSETQLEKVINFNKAFNVPHIDGPPSLDTIEDRINLRMNLIAEEFCEIVEAVYGSEASETIQKVWKTIASDHDEKRRDVFNLSSELADLIFVINGFAHEANIPLDEIFDEVYRANMSKLDDNEKPVVSDGVTPDLQGKVRPAGKILKGPNFKPPQTDAIIQKHIDSFQKD